MSQTNAKQAQNTYGIFENAHAFQPNVNTAVESRYESEVFIPTEPIRWMANEIQHALEFAAHNPAALEISYNNGKFPDERYQPKDKDGNLLEERVRPQLKPITSISDAFVAAFTVALGARIVTVSKEMRFNFRPRDFEFISVFGPVLGAYGEYQDEKEGYEIKPKLSAEMKSMLEAYGAIRNGQFCVPLWYREAMHAFRIWHVFTAIGLPREQLIKDPSIFKVTVENGFVIGKSDVNNAQVLMSALASATRIEELFGAYRTLYSGVTYLRGTFENLAVKVLHQLDAHMNDSVQ